MALTVLTVGMAFIVDLIVGDPPWIPHPVVIIGKAISGIERALRRFCTDERRERLFGGLLTVTVVLGAYLSCRWVIEVAFRGNHLLGAAVSVWLMSTAFAARGLDKAARGVTEPLLAGDIEKARERVGMIVGRDTENLPVEEVVRATVETVAENTCDGVIAPLIYAFIGGAPLAMAYKAVNTLDSMVGHKDAKYLNFGRVSAKLDDVANYVPARVAGLLLAAASRVLGHDWKRALRTMISDGRNHPSPNSGMSEAAVAGALGIRLGGTNYYKGIPSFRGYMGEPENPLEPCHIRQTVALMYTASLMCVAAGTVALALLS